MFSVLGLFSVAKQHRLVMACCVACLFVPSLFAGMWTYTSNDPNYFGRQTLSHSSTPWVLYVNANGKQLAVTGWEETTLNAPLALPLGDGVDDGYTVTSISDWAFYDCPYLAGNLILPGSVTSIGTYAFFNCSGISSIIVPASVAVIGSYAFTTYATNHLDVVFCGLPPVVNYLYGSYWNWNGTATSYIRSEYLNEWNQHTSFPIEHGTTWQGFYISLNWWEFNDDGTAGISHQAWPFAFNVAASGTSLTLLSLAGQLTEPFRIPFVDPIFKTAQTGPAEINRYAISEIGSHVFSGVGPLMVGKLSLPDSVTNIGASAFAGCSGITGALNLPAQLASLGASAFSGCSGFTGRITIPDSLTGIAAAVFKDCSGITSISVPEAVTSIGTEAFAGQTNLTTVYYHGPCPAVSQPVYDDSPSVISYVFPGHVSDWNLSPYLQDGLIGAGQATWMGKPIRLLEEGWVFDPEAKTLSHTRLPWELNVKANDGNLRICSVVTQNLDAPYPLPLADVVNGGFRITEIADGAFGGYSEIIGTDVWLFTIPTIGTLVLPDTLIYIGDSAFADCLGFTGELVIPDSVTTIGSWAFSGCNGLTAITVPASISSIGYCAFVCRNLLSVTYQGFYPESVQWDIYDYYASVTSYVYRVCAESWEPFVYDGPIEGGAAFWENNPIRIREVAGGAFSVSFDPQGGSGVSPGTASVSHGATYGPLATPSRLGYTFRGWYTAPAGGRRVTADSVVLNPAPHTLYAQWFPVLSAATATATLNSPDFGWAVDGDGAWFTQTAVSHAMDGAAMQSGAIGHNQQSVLSATVTGPAFVRFWWKVSSEQGYDFLRVLLDDSEQHAISGEVDWQRRLLVIPAGTHTLQWGYEKNGSWSEGEDCGWLDQVSLVTEPDSGTGHFWLWADGLASQFWLPEHLSGAHDDFAADIRQDANNIEARIYRAITALGKLADNAALQSLIAQFGVTVDMNTFTPAYAPVDMGEAPPSNETADRIAAEVLPAINAALADLDAIPAGWAGSVEISAEDSGFDETVYVDIADVLLAKSALYAARAAVQVAQAYDLSVDYSKTNVHEMVAAPFAPPVLEVTVTSDFSEWDDVPALLVGNKEILEYVKLARSETQMFLLAKANEGMSIEWFYAGFYTGTGSEVRYNDIGGIPEGVPTICYGYEGAYWDEISEGWFAYEVEYTVLKVGERLLIIRDLPVELVGEPFSVQYASASADCWDIENGHWYWDYANWQSQTRLQPAGRFLEDHPDFMRTVRDAAKLPLAKENLRSALQSVQAADTSITGRAGDAWHFIEFAPEQTNWLADARQKLTEALNSLDAPQHTTISYTNVKEVVIHHWDEIYDPINGWWDYVYAGSSIETQRTEVINTTENIYLGALFEAPYLTCALLPRFSKDSEVVLGSFTDPTFGGVLPDWTTSILESNLVGRVPVMKERAFQIGGQWFHTGGRGLWSLSDDGTDGDIAQSGEIRRAGKTSWVETTVAGPGVLDFSWALTEAMDRESCLEIHVDGLRQAGTIWGDTGWVPHQLEIPAGRHTVRWTYTLAYEWTEDAAAEASFGWLTDFLWTPDQAQTHTTGTPVDVPYVWLDGYPGLFGPDDDYESVVMRDQDDDGMETWKEYVADTNPLDPKSVFLALISVNGSQITIDWTPNRSNRDYEVVGKTDLREPEWGSTNNPATRFFRVKVSLP